MEKKSLLNWGSLLRGLYFFLGICFLSACSIQGQRAELTQSLDLSTSIQDSFLAKDFTPSEWISESWWEMFQDPQLNCFIETALQNNPSIQSAIETVMLAHETARQSFSAILPKVDAEFSEALFAFNWKREGLKINSSVIPKNILPNWINLLGAILSFRWSLDIWGKEARLYKAFIDETKGQMAYLAYTKLLLSVQVAHAYIQFQTALKIEALQESMLQAEKERLFILEQMQIYALADESSMDRVKKELLEIQLKLISTQEDLKKMGYQLKVFMAQSPDDPKIFEMPKAHFDFPFPFPNQVSLDLLAKRPDIVTKIWNVQAAIKRVNSAKVSFFPSINLSSLSGYMTLTYKELMEPRGWFTSILPGASLPLFHGFKLRANLNAQLRQYNQAVWAYNQTLLEAAQEVVDSITSFHMANRRLREQEALLKKSQHILEISERRFEYGLNTVPQVLLSKVSFLKDQIDYELLIKARLLAILNLIKSIGGGYDQPEAQVDMEQAFIYE